MKSLAGIIFVLMMWACGNQTQPIEKKKEVKLEKENRQEAFNKSAYELMEKRCFICHFPKPDPARKGSMIAPPMMRVKEHYLPSFPEKNEFVEAIVGWVNHPSEENTLMPGSVRKFKLMPKLSYSETEIEVIAKILYDYDFGTFRHKRMGHKHRLHLNQGKKWTVNKKSIATMHSIVKKLSSFEAKEVEAYRQLGKDIFDDAKVVLMDDSYSGETFDQLHYFFNEIEEDLHALMRIKSIEKAKGKVEILKVRFEKFFNYFE
jgi:hypothetical protein